MTSRERVLRTLDRAGPDRVPRDLWALPWAEAHYPAELAALRRDFPPDLVTAPGFRRAPQRSRGDMYGGATYVDEWGCTFVALQPGYIGEVKQPLVADWSDLDRVRPPEELLSIDVDRINAWCKAESRFVKADCCPRPFERLQFLRGSENVYLDLAEGRPELFELLRRIHEFYLRELDVWLRTDVDAAMFMDDWGAQRALLIAPERWRAVFLPLYRDYVALAHERGKRCFMHSDGYILDIIPDLIGLGLDALNAQIFCMGVGELGRRFRGKITFWGEMDRQHLLPYGSREDIVQAVREVRDALWDGGGVIAQCEFGPGARPENVRTVFETWDALGVR